MRSDLRTALVSSTTDVQGAQQGRPNSPAGSMSPSSHQHPPVVGGSDDSCCGMSGCWVRLWRLWHVDDQESPRGAQMEAQYQAPVVTPPSSALAMRTYEEEPTADTEQRRLLPKWSEQSAPLRADETGAASTSAASITTQHAVGAVGLTASAGSHTAKTQQAHRRTGSGSDIVRPSSAQGRHHGATQLSRHRKGHSLTASELAGKGTITEVPSAAQVTVAQDDDDSDFCPTCLEPYSEENPKTHTACGHHYHLPCLYEWLERSDTCPTCLSPLQFNGM